MRPNQSANLLPDALLLGVQKRLAEQHLPALEKIANAASSDKKLLAEYALVLEEKDRAVFLDVFPEERHREVASILDASVATLLHQSLVEKKTRRKLSACRCVGAYSLNSKGRSKKNEPSDRHLTGLFVRSDWQSWRRYAPTPLELVRDEVDQGDATKDESKKKNLSTFLGFLKYSSIPLTTGAATISCFVWRATSA